MHQRKGYEPSTKMGSDYKKARAANSRKKFVRYKEGAELYSLGLHTFERIAREAGAVYKIDRIALVNTELIDKYLETFRLPPT